MPRSDLEPATVGELVTGADLELREFRGLDLADCDGSAARFLECALVDCRLDAVRLRGARVLASEFVDAGATSLDATRSTWRDVTLTGCRFGALEMSSSIVTEVLIRGSKVDFVNLRGAELSRVVFEDCLLGELRLAEAELRSVEFRDCRIRSLELRRARCTEVDLRGADLREVDGVEHLRGVRISEGQLVELAPALAAHVGLKVGDPPPAAPGRGRGRATATSGPGTEW